MLIKHWEHKYLKEKANNALKSAWNLTRRLTMSCERIKNIFHAREERTRTLLLLGVERDMSDLNIWDEEMR